jgi:hypothetical protein
MLATVLFACLGCEIVIVGAHIWEAAKGDSLDSRRRTADITFICISLTGTCIAFIVNLLGVKVVATMLWKVVVPMFKRGHVAPAPLPERHAGNLKAADSSSSGNTGACSNAGEASCF